MQHSSHHNFSFSSRASTHFTVMKAQNIALEAIYCYEIVNIVTKIFIHYLFLNYNISDAREIFIFGEKLSDFS